MLKVPPAALAAGFAALIGLAALAAGRWHPVHTILAVMGGTCVGLVWLASAAKRMGPPNRPTGEPRTLAGGPTARQVRGRAVELYTAHPHDSPAELATRVRAWYGGGTVRRSAGDLNSCLLLPVLLPLWLVRDALFAPTPEGFNQSVSDAVTHVTGQPPPAGGAW